MNGIVRTCIVTLLVGAGLLATTAFGYVIDYKGILLKNAKWGYIDTAGRVVIEPQFEQAGKFSEGRAAVRVGGKWGYIDVTGKVVVPPRYVAAEPFAQGLAAVAVLPPVPAEILAKDGPVNPKDFRWGYVNPAGTLVVPATFSSAGRFSDGRARVQRDDKFGFIGRDGKLAIEPRFDGVTDFSDGLAAVRVDGNWGFIDVAGAVIITPQFAGVQSGGFHSGLAPVQVEVALGERWGYIDRDGRVVIAAEYEAAWPFENGLAMVKRDGKHGFIDTLGRVVVPIKYWQASPFSEGLAHVEENSNETGHWGYVDTAGRPAFANKRLSASFHSGRCWAQVFNPGEHDKRPMGSCGFVDATGQLVIPANLDWAEEFSEGLAAFATAADQAAVKRAMDAERGIGVDKPGL